MTPEDKISMNVFSSMAMDLLDPPYLNQYHKKQDLEELCYSLEQDMDSIAQQTFVTDDMYKRLAQKTLNLAISISSITK